MTQMRMPGANGGRSAGIGETETATDLRYAFLCALLVVVAGLATLPFTEAGVNDDWTYIRMAFDFARTGEIRYNGWSAPILGIQAVWGGLFAKLFGNSFTAVRLSVLPFAAGVALLTYTLHRRAGIRATHAAFGTLVCLLNPVVIPVSVMFMTDIPGLCLTLLTLYAAVRAAETPPERRSAFFGWLGLVVLAGFLAGSVRQIFWVAPGMSLLYLAYRQRATRLPALAAFLIVLLGAGAAQAWYGRQPYAIPESVRSGIVFLIKAPQQWVPLILMQAATLAILLLPIFAIVLSARQRLFTLQRQGAMILIAISTVLGLALWYRQALFPWANANLWTVYGILDAMTLGSRPVVLPTFIRFVLTVCGLSAIGLFYLSTRSEESIAADRTTARSLLSKGQAVWNQWPEVVRVYVLFTVAYVALTLLRASLGYAFDRYLIPILPLASILLLRRLSLVTAFPRFGALVGGVILTLYTLFGIAATHDYFALVQAENRAVEQLIRAGIPRHQIRAGFEQDAWTELETRGYFNYMGIATPRDAYRKPGPELTPAVLGAQPPRFWWNMTPSIEARYFVVTTPLEKLTDAPYPPVSYRTWLPPFTREIYFQQLPPPVTTEGGP
jgi:hypothetical protein